MRRMATPLVDSCSPHGDPTWDGSFGDDGSADTVDCLDIFPYFVNPLLTGARLADIQAKLTGQPIGGACFRADDGDHHARGYVTIENAKACSLIFPDDPDYYFAEGIDAGVASDVNQLWGDWTLIDPANALTRLVDPLVHIEADEGFDDTSTPSGYTFYGRYTQGLGGIDHREPLASAWAFSYLNVGPGLVTDLVVWRDSTADNQGFGGFPCGTGPGAGPDWHPLPQTQVTCFDQAEGAVEICAGDACFPLESQRVALGSGGFAVPFAAGWCQLNLDVPGDKITGDADFPLSPPGDVHQSWVGATVRDAGVVAGGFGAVAVAHACEDASPTITVHLVFADGFESGDTSRWS